jgi:hypothetical protein
MAKRRFITLIGILAILSLAWTAFVKPEKERAKALSQIEISATMPAVDQQQHNEAGVDAKPTSGLAQFWKFTGFRNATKGHFIMIAVGLFFIFLAIKYDYEPLLLIPIGVGILIGNIPFPQDPGINLQIGIYQEGSVLNYLYFGVMKGVYPPLIFLGIGAMTDFSSLISNPRLMLLGAAAQIGIFITLLGALLALHLLKQVQSGLLVEPTVQQQFSCRHDWQTESIFLLMVLLLRILSDLLQLPHIHIWLLYRLFSLL